MLVLGNNCFYELNPFAKSFDPFFQRQRGISISKTYPKDISKHFRLQVKSAHEHFTKTRKVFTKFS